MRTLHVQIFAAALCLAAAACTPVPDPDSAPAPVPPPAPETGPMASPARPPIPGAPGIHVHTPEALTTPNSLPPDAQFLHHMIPHHAQALVMTALVPARTTRPELRLVAERIAVSQRDEIAQMQAWLRARGHPVPAVDTAPPAATASAETSHGAHATHPMYASPHSGMPGMLSPLELASLAAVRGPEFDRLFLQLMIRHHEGAITMVQDLFARGGGQESQVFSIASEVESDQRMEIARMQSILATLPSPAPAPR